MKDCRDYFLETSRRVSFEYTLLGTEVSFGEIRLSGDGRQESERSVFSKLYQINTKPVQFHIYMNFLYALETPFGMLGLTCLKPII